MGVMVARHRDIEPDTRWDPPCLPVARDPAGRDRSRVPIDRHARGRNEDLRPSRTHEQPEDEAGGQADERALHAGSSSMSAMVVASAGNGVGREAEAEGQSH
jgi:hypothetical protein